MQIGLGAAGLGKYIRYIPYPVVSGFMTAIGVIILVTQILPSIGYNAKEDVEFVKQFETQVEEVVLNRYLKDTKNNNDTKTLTLGDFKNAVSKGESIIEADIIKESKNLASKEASGVLGTIKVLPRALKFINWLELILALGTIFIIYGFKRITTAVSKYFSCISGNDRYICRFWVLITGQLKKFQQDFLFQIWGFSQSLVSPV